MTDPHADPEVDRHDRHPNPRTGSSDAARGLSGHTKDADHAPGSTAGHVEKGEPVERN